MQRFGFDFDAGFRAAAIPFGITPRTAWVEVDDHHVRIRFGPWHMVIERRNIAETRLTGPYDRWRVIGPAHLSFRDHGVTFATNPRRGVCLVLAQPVPGIDPFRMIRHHGVTLTIEDPDRFAALVTGHGAATSTSDIAG